METLCPWRAVDNNGQRPVHCFPPLVPSQSAEQITALCGSFNDTQTHGMEGPRESPDPPPRPLARHLSDADRLRKVIQELVDTEKSYVKVMEGAALSSLPVPARGVVAGSPGSTAGTPPCTRQGLPLDEVIAAEEGEKGERWQCLEDSGKI